MAKLLRKEARTGAQAPVLRHTGPLSTVCEEWVNPYGKWYLAPRGWNTQEHATTWMNGKHGAA